MQFIYPTFLFALAAIAIPIIIHLFHFRRFKKVYFTNVRFLREVKEETANRSRLRNLLVLLMRILAIAFLVFAFAQPFIPQDNATVRAGQKAVSVYVDNSFSMDARTADVPLLEKAKERARQIVMAYNVDDEFQILTCDFEGRHQRLVSQEDALQLIDEIKPTFAVKTAQKVMDKQRQTLSTAKAANKLIYFISDFQKNVTDLETVQDTTVEVNLVPLQAVQVQNVSVDSCWFEAPVQMLNQPSRLVVQVSNLSDEAVEEVRLSLKLNGQVKPVGNLNLAANETYFDTVNITPVQAGWQEAEISITDYPINFDDVYYFTFNVQQSVKVLTLNEGGENQYLKAAFGNTGFFQVQNQSVSNIDYSKLPENQLVILNEITNLSSGLSAELKQYIEGGGNVVVFPNKNANLENYKTLCNGVNANVYTGFKAQKREVTFINTDEFIFNDVYINKSANLKLPNTNGNFALTRNRPEEVLLRYRDGGSFLSKYTYEGGNLFLCAAPLQTEFSSLVQNAEIFVPMLYKMAISTGKTSQLAYVIGKDDVLESDNKITGSETLYKLKGGAEEFIPGQKNMGNKVVLSINNQIENAGFYDLFLTEAQPLYKFAFNYDRRESELSYFEAAELKEKIGNFAAIINASAKADFRQIIGERSKGIVLWKWCLVFALLFLLAEVLLLRFWKV
jgi:hypothetical protein